MTDPRIAEPAKERPSVRPLTCPNCGGTIALRAAGTTVSLVCEHCGSTLDATDPELAVIVRADAAMRRPPIALGTCGTLDGTPWEVVGYQERSDGEVLWAEYLLFNPYEGYRFLVDDGRRFSLGTLMTAMPGQGWQGLSYAGHGYKRFGVTYPVRTQFVVGEFYWRVRVGEQVDETDYVREGTMLSAEENDSERTWTELRMLDWGVAERAFGIAARPANDNGTPAPHEPNPYRRALRDALFVAALALVAIVVIAIGSAGSQRVLDRQLAVKLDGSTQTTVLGPIDVSGAREKVAITGKADRLDNMWVDLDYSLVNKATQESVDAYGTAEYYHGRDSDGDWSEGDSSPNTALASIPRGTYDLVVEASAHRWQDPKANTSTGIFATDTVTPFAGGNDTATVPVRITVDRGGGFAGNFFTALLVIAIWPLIAMVRSGAWEKRRMAPVTGSDDDDEDDD